MLTSKYSKIYITFLNPLKLFCGCEVKDICRARGLSITGKVLFYTWLHWKHSILEKELNQKKIFLHSKTPQQSNFHDLFCKNFTKWKTKMKIPHKPKATIIKSAVTLWRLADFCTVGSRKYPVKFTIIIRSKYKKMVFIFIRIY